MPSTNGLLLDIVTGASQGIGKAIAESIAQARAASAAPAAYELVLVGRNVERGSRAAIEIAKSSGLAVSFEACDLGNYKQVQALKRRIREKHTTDDTQIRIGILVNDAAECPKKQRLVERSRLLGKDQIVTETIDAQFATNVLGYHFMMRTFEDWFDSSHIVNIASNWAGDLDLQDLHFQKRRSYDNDTAYRQSKQCNRMLSVLWAERLRDKALVNACHPGDPRTMLSCALGYNMYAAPPDRTFMESRYNPIMYLCGLAKTPLTTTGGWYDGGTSPQQDYYANRREQAQELFDICESYCGGV